MIKIPFKLLSNAKPMLFVMALSLFSLCSFAQASFTFSYTGSTQTITLPAGVYSIQCWGADGGSVAANTALPGKGGYSSGTISFSSSTTFTIYVGGKGNGGSQPLGGFNSGNGLTKTNVSTATGGGGASDVRVLANSLYNRIIVAGGGGGQGTSSGTGGHGGGLTGQNGQGTTNAGVGGTQNAPGLYPPGGDAKPATFGEGGDGPAGTTGGQGGGGWYGGSFGTRTNGGGAGGSGYVLTASSFTPVGYFAAHSNYYFSNPVTLRADQGGFVTNPDASGNGRVIITQLCNISLGTNTGSNLLCLGSALTLTTDAISNYTWSTGSNASSITVSPSITTTYSLAAMSQSLCMTSAAITITVSNAAPALTVTASSPTVCLGNTVSISASGALTYSFSGGISNGVAFTPTSTTAYTVQGQNGCGTASAVTTITIAPLPVNGLANPSVVCAGNSATLSGLGASSYTWLPGNIVGTNVIVSPQANTTYTVLGEAGTCFGTNTIAVNANPNPTLTASASNSMICQGETVTLTASGALNYTWQPVNQTGSSIVVTPTAPIAYQVSGDNSFGCISTVQQPVVVFPAPAYNLSTSTPTICEGNSATLSVSGTNSYSWSTGATGNSISVTPAATSVFTVVGTNTTTQCSNTKTIQVTVFVSSISISSPTGICTGSSATLTANGATAYNWNTGANSSQIIVSPTGTSIYSVSGITSISSGTCAGTASVQVIVNPLPIIGIGASQTLICRFCPVTLTATGASSYNWLFVGTGSSVIVSPTVQTVYTVQGTDANGCVGTATILIRVFSCLCGASINEFAEAFSQIQISPNPSSGSFLIKGPAQVELLLINEIGQFVSQIELRQENNFEVQVKNLAPGIYFLRAKAPAIKFTKKIVVH